MKKIVSILLTGFVLFSCKTLTVINDLDRSIDFSKYKTIEFYGWTDSKIGNGSGGSFFKNRIEKELQAEFLKRGIETVKKGEGDMIISLFVVSEKKTESYANTSTSYPGVGMGVYGGYGYGRYYGYGPGYGWGAGYGQSTTTYTEHDYSEGTLIVSAYDASKQELIWETIASKSIDRDSKNPEEEIKKAVAKIMTTYPVQPVK